MSRRVLICDDSLLMRRMIRETLVAAGWEVVGEAHNGEEAALQYELLKPDVVTMDIVMPDHDGLHGLHRIMQCDPTAKVVMVSSLHHTKPIADAIREGARDFIVKPFMPEQFQATVEGCAGSFEVAGSA
jgi:two-component system chemotaxis response regulator CheY